MPMTVAPTAALPVSPAACAPAACDPGAAEAAINQPGANTFNSTVQLSAAARNVIVSGNNNTTIVNNVDIDVIQLPARHRGYFLPVGRRPVVRRPVAAFHAGWMLGRTFRPVMPWAR